MAESRPFAEPVAVARLVGPGSPDGAPLGAAAPALAAMTDFRAEAAHVVSPSRRIDDALEDMIHFGVRLLLVANDHEIIGVITSYDIMGERPVQFLRHSFREGTARRHADITVADVMTPLAELRTLRLDWVEGATVGEVAALFDASTDTHLLVRHPDWAGGAPLIRGVFSRTRLERQRRAP